MPAADQPHDSVRRFRANLMELYRRAGSPTPEEMARRSLQPPGVFLLFLASSDLPTWEDMTSVLIGIGEAGQVRHWRRRWEVLSEQQRLAKTKPAIARTAGSGSIDGVQKDVVITDVFVARTPDGDSRFVTKSVEVDRHRAGPLNAALAASTPAEFGEALRLLQLDAGLSVRAIEKKTLRVLKKSVVDRLTKGERPPTPGQARVFAQACGRSSEEAEAWEDIADRIRRAEPSTWQHSAIPAAELLALGGEQEDPRDERIRTLERENEQLRVLLDSTVRAFRAVNGDLTLAREAAAASAGAADKQRSATGSEVDGVRYDFHTHRSRPMRWGSVATG